MCLPRVFTVSFPSFVLHVSGGRSVTTRESLKLLDPSTVGTRDEKGSGDVGGPGQGEPRRYLDPLTRGEDLKVRIRDGSSSLLWVASGRHGFCQNPPTPRCRFPLTTHTCIRESLRCYGPSGRTSSTVQPVSSSILYRSSPLTSCSFRSQGSYRHDTPPNPRCTTDSWTTPSPPR